MGAFFDTIFFCQKLIKAQVILGVFFGTIIFGQKWIKTQGYSLAIFVDFNPNIKISNINKINSGICCKSYLTRSQVILGYFFRTILFGQKLIKRQGNSLAIFVDFDPNIKTSITRGICCKSYFTNFHVVLGHFLAK